MSMPFLRKEKDGISIKLHRALYPSGAIEAFRASGEGVTVGQRGAYWMVKCAGHDEAQAMDALEKLLVLSKGKRAQ